MKKKILHLLNTNTFSGAENVVCTIIKNMKNDYDIVYCSPEGPISKKLSEENIDYFPIKKLSYFELKRALNVIKPDIIHAHDNRATVLASFFANDYKVISHIHGNNKIMNSCNLKTILFNSCSKKVNKIIWVSDSALNDYFFKKNICDKSVVLYNVINQDEVIEKSKMYECEEEYDLIYLGRLGYPKNPERLIEIIKLLKVKKDNIKVAIVGDGVERSKVEELITQYNLEGNIKMYGFKSNPFPILKKSKILIMTSIYEGTPMCALEAQALGKPIVATPVDGLKRIVQNNYNGFLSDINDEIVQFIIKQLEDEYLYLKTSNASNIVFKKNNNLKCYCKKIASLYEKGEK